MTQSKQPSRKEKTENLTFEEALIAIKSGKRVAVPEFKTYLQLHICTDEFPQTAMLLSINEEDERFVVLKHLNINLILSNEWRIVQ